MTQIIPGQYKDARFRKGHVVREERVPTGRLFRSIPPVLMFSAKAPAFSWGSKIIPGQYKDARFRKGHVVREEDIPVLLSMGKENLYVCPPCAQPGCRAGWQP